MSMLSRCYSAKIHERQPTYRECVVCEEWLIFSKFSEWMSSQDWIGKVLDKDILIPGNKQYGPDKCVFIDDRLNSFVTDRVMHRGDYPIGVTYHKASKKFLSSCCNPDTGIKEYIGIYDCPNVAHEAWRVRKHFHALKYADKQTDPRISIALRNRYLPKMEAK